MNDISPTVDKCAAQHFGPWMIEPEWFAEAVGHVKAGTFVAAQSGPDEGSDLYQTGTGGVARIGITGQMTKGESSFGGASTVRTRQAIRRAVQDDGVRAILLHIDSPGGTVAGTADLAADVRAANEEKPVYTYFDDLGCSAAYWVGSQARHIAAGPTALVGSIGTVAVVEDSSGAMDRAGIKVHVVSTGKHKGAFADGAPITDEQLEALQVEVDDLNDHFLAGVAEGRHMTIEQVQGVADGRVHIASKAKDLGLIDAVQSLDQTLQDISQELYKMDNPIEAFAAEQPDAVSDWKNEGHVEGYADAKRDEGERLAALIDKYGDDPEFVLEQYTLGHDIGKAREAFVLKKEAELAAREAEVKAAEERASSGLEGIVWTATSDEPEPDSPKKPDPDDHKAVAEWEWDNDAELRENYKQGKESYVKFRVNVLSGKLRVLKR